MLSQTAEHALRAVLFLASRPPGETVPSDRIARSLGAPGNYLSKTLQGLARAGLVEGVRGPSGGFRLRVDPADLDLATLLDAVDEPTRISTCLMGDRPCDEREPCAAHACWTAVREAARAPLLGTTVLDLAEGRCPEALPAPVAPAS